MPNITKWAASGLHCVQMGLRGSGGNFAGFANLDATDTGTASNARLLKGAVTAPSPAPPITRVRNRGEDGEIAAFAFRGASPDLVLTFEAFDGDMAAAMNQDTVLTEGEWDIVPEGTNISFQDTMWLVCREAQSLESDSYLQPGFENALYMNAGGRIMVGNMEYQAAGQVTAELVASAVEKTHKGTTSLASFGKNNFYVSRWFSDYPCSISCFVGDNSIVAIPLGFAPVNTAKTKVYRFDTGAALTVSSVSVGSKTATVSAAPTSGLLTVAVYESMEL